MKLRVVLYVDQFFFEGASPDTSLSVCRLIALFSTVLGCELNIGWVVCVLVGLYLMNNCALV